MCFPRLGALLPPAYPQPTLDDRRPDPPRDETRPHPRPRGRLRPPLTTGADLGFRDARTPISRLSLVRPRPPLGAPFPSSGLFLRQAAVRGWTFGFGHEPVNVFFTSPRPVAITIIIRRIILSRVCLGATVPLSAGGFGSGAWTKVRTRATQRPAGQRRGPRAGYSCSRPPAGPLSPASRSAWDPLTIPAPLPQVRSPPAPRASGPPNSPSTPRPPHGPSARPLPLSPRPSPRPQPPPLPSPPRAQGGAARRPFQIRD